MGVSRKDGTYCVAGVMIGGRKWYLRCFRFFFYILEVLDGLCVWIKV